jgi:hypothetical protein
VQRIRDSVDWTRPNYARLNIERDIGEAVRVANKTVHRRYTRSIFENLRYRATWFPNERLQLGDVGVIDDGIFVARTSLKSLGVTFSRQRANSGAHFEYQSETGVSLSTKARGKLAPGFTALGRGEGGVLVRFKEAGAVVFSAPDCRLTEIRDTESLKPQLETLGRKWSREWVIVTKVVTATTATILVANSKGAEVELKAQAGVRVSPTLQITKLAAGFELVRDSNMAAKLVASGRLVPLYLVDEFVLERSIRHPRGRSRIRRRRKAAKRSPAKKAQKRK